MDILVLANWQELTYISGDVDSKMVIIVGNGHGDPSSNTRQGCLHFT